MLKLYKKIADVLHYHEAWATKSSVIEHWGEVGDRGHVLEHIIKRGVSKEDTVRAVLQKAIEHGYHPIDQANHVTLVVEYKVAGMGSAKDLEKRHKLEERMNELLGWTGLGDCDGGSIGSGTMEVACFVVDFQIARRVIEKDLRGTNFSDYERIYAENGD